MAKTAVAAASYELARSRIAKARYDGADQLDLSRLGLTTLPPVIASLTALHTLNLDDNQLTTLPPVIGSLTSLQALHFSGNQLTALPPKIGSLTALQTLNLAGNQLTTLPPEIGSLAALRTLNLDSNRLTTLPPEIGHLTALQTLHLDGNQLSGLPREIGLLDALQTLHLNGNQLSELPREIGLLVGLTDPHFSQNDLNMRRPGPTRISCLEYLLLHGNPRLELPPELLGPDPTKVPVERGNWVKAKLILDYYFERLSGGAHQLNEVKIILVGRGGAGKTSISAVLRGQSIPEHQESTPGIALDDWEMKDCEGGAVTAHLWDFAGQVITHAMHQFFFTTRTVYVLVLTGRENSERADAEYWLRLIRAFGTDEQGNGPPVVVALNKWDVDGCRPRVDRGALREQYPFISKFVEMDCKSQFKIDSMRSAIKMQVQSLPWVRQEIPRHWDDVRKELAGETRSYLTFDDFRAVCSKRGVTDGSKQESLAQLLHNLGVALNYRNDPRLREATVLKPEWLTGNAYSLIRAAERMSGLLTLTDAAVALKVVTDPHMRDYMLLLLERFEIAYRLKKDHTAMWLLPQALPDEQPTGVEKFGTISDATRLRYTYAAMPEGLVPRAIVRLHDFVEQDAVGNRKHWASGAVLVLEGARALVRANPQDRQVMVTVTGPADARRQLAGLCRSEFRAIHEDIRGLNPVEEMLALEAWVPTAILEKDEHSGQSTGVYNKDIGTVPMDPAKLNNQFTRPEARSMDHKPRAFISYSKSNVAQRDRLVKQLVILKNEGLIADHWHDRMIDPGDKWDDSIKTELTNAQLFILLVSDDALSTKYITEMEIPMALEQHEAGKVVVVPIILKDCRWSQLKAGKTKIALKDLQALPEKGKAVDKWNPRSGAWKSIADGLAKVLAKLGERA